MELSYHYTTIEKFQKMLENSKNEDGKISDFKFWASSIYSMNDPLEFIYGFDKLWKEVIPEIEKEIGIKDAAYKISKLYQSYDRSRTGEQNNKIIEALYESHQLPFIISFSKNKDFLPMWTTYANNGNGICLGFNNCEYEIKLKGNDADVKILHRLHAMRVKYNDFDETIKKTLKKMYLKNYRDYAAVKDEKRRHNMMISALVAFSVTASPYHKHKAYEYESEDRLILFKDDETDVQYRCNDRGHLIPYIEVPVKKEYLKKVIIGPCSDYVALKRELICEFAKYGIPLGEDSIIPSNVPYRVY